MKVTIEAFETYPAGVYPATVKEVTEDDGSTYGPQYRFKFSLGGALEGKTMTGWCRQSGSVKSKFFEWYTALTGHAPKPGEEVDTDELIGKTAQLVIKIKKNDDGSEKNVIDSVLPLSQQNGNGHKPPVVVMARDNKALMDRIGILYQRANALKIDFAPLPDDATFDEAIEYGKTLKGIIEMSE